MGKITHETPVGFREIKLSHGRVTYAAKLGAKATHVRFLAQARRATKNWGPGDPGRKLYEHMTLGHRFFLTADLKSAFDHITFTKLECPLGECGINPAWLTPLSYFFHEGGCGGLIQGASPSGILSEICLRFGGFDHAIFDYCDKLGFYYTRFADDLLISSPRHLGKRIVPSVRRLVEQHGFYLNEKKTRRVDTYTERLRVLGYVVQGSTMRADPRFAARMSDPNVSPWTREGLAGYVRRAEDLNALARKRRHKNRG